MVKFVSDKTGRFTQRPHYLPAELDRECERIITAFLKDRRGKVEFPIETDDLQVLIEQRVNDLDAFSDLSEYGTEVEGLTEFRPGKKPNVRISASLASDDRRENRLRTTLTHEFGHVHFHTYLWETHLPSADLFRTRKEANKQICKRENMINASQNDWMEWQAGYVCGAILMPASFVRQLVGAYKEGNKIFGSINVDGTDGMALLRKLQSEFQVSAEAARVRLFKLNLLSRAEPTLSLFD